jgi:4-amino-4-deoxy-L-arabinose transferase-like glycosyltransferase
MLNDRLPNRLLAILFGLLLADTAAASDMTVLMFVVSFPVCLVLVGISFAMASLLRPSWYVFLVLPFVALLAVHLWMLPEMYHREEQILFAIQAIISLTVLFALRRMWRRATASAAHDEHTAD